MKLNHNMRTLLTFVGLLFYQIVVGQFAVVLDNEGFVNVRNSGELSNNIIDTIYNGDVVYCFEGEDNWIPVDYDLDLPYRSGYIHKSRLKFIGDFTRIPFERVTNTLVSFKNDSLALTLIKIPFDIKANILHYHTATGRNESTYLEKINDKEFWGTDGNVPKYQYDKVLLKIKDKEFNLPIENLFEPTLDYTLLNVDSENGIIYITAYNSDAAGAYAVLWIVVKGQFKQRIVTIPF